MQRLRGQTDRQRVRIVLDRAHGLHDGDVMVARHEIEVRMLAHLADLVQLAAGAVEQRTDARLNRLAPVDRAAGRRQDPARADDGTGAEMAVDGVLQRDGERELTDGGRVAADDEGSGGREAGGRGCETTQMFS